MASVLRFDDWETTLGTGVVSTDGSGNVAVGGSSPSYKLDVTGDINASGALRIGGTAIGDWATFTPNFQPQTGTWTSSTLAAAKYAVVNDVVFGFCYMAITNFGTGNDAVFFDLPVTAAANQHQIGTGRESALTGNVLNVYLISTTSAAIRFYNNQGTAFANHVLSINFAYQAA